MSRAGAGQRQAEALEAIRGFEQQGRDWDAKELGEAIGISPQQARALIATLTVRGELELREVSVVRKRLVLTNAAKAA